MKTVEYSSLDINAIKGALVTNTNGAEFYVTGISVDLETHDILVWMADTGDESIAKPTTFGVYWEALKDWEIQLQPLLHLP